MCYVLIYVKDRENHLIFSKFTYTQKINQLYQYQSTKIFVNQLLGKTQDLRPFIYKARNGGLRLQQYLVPEMKIIKSALFGQKLYCYVGSDLMSIIVNEGSENC